MKPKFQKQMIDNEQQKIKSYLKETTKRINTFTHGFNEAILEIPEAIKKMKWSSSDEDLNS